MKGILMKSVKQILKDKLETKTAKIGVVGLGYVGLPFAVEKAKVGFIDHNPIRVNQINNGENYITDVKDEQLRELVKGKRSRRRPVLIPCKRWT